MYETQIDDMADLWRRILEVIEIKQLKPEYSVTLQTGYTIRAHEFIPLRGRYLNLCCREFVYFPK